MRIIEQIKAALAVDRYIGDLIPVRNGKAHCPFHDEKSASLAVHEDYWKCFGCGAGGDVVTFAARFHGVSIREAVRLLAAEAGIAMEREPAAHPYDAAKEARVRAEAAEWQRQTRTAMVSADDYETSYPFIADLDALTRAEASDAYLSERTPERAAMLRESAKRRAMPTVESLVVEFLRWSRNA